MNSDTMQRPNTATIPPQSNPPPKAATAAVLDPQSAYQEVKEVVGEQLRQVTSDLKESGGEALQSAKNAGTHYLDEQKEKLAAGMDRYTEAVNAACDTLQSDAANPLVSPGRRASRQMERASEYLRNHSAMDFLDDLGALARRRPEIVFGGLFLASLVSVRFLKASSRGNRKSLKSSAYRGPNNYLSEEPYPLDFNGSELQPNFRPNPSV